MYKTMNKILNNEKGFTLVELMVVVVIIGILVAIAIPIYNNTTARAERGSCEANLRMIDSAIQQYKMVNDISPNIDLTTLDGFNFEEEILIENAGYLDSTPTCPAGDEAYQLGEGNYAVCPNEADHSYR